MQGLHLADKMREHQVLVVVDEAADMVHAFQLLAPYVFVVPVHPSNTRRPSMC